VYKPRKVVHRKGVVCGVQMSIKFDITTKVSVDPGEYSSREGMFQHIGAFLDVLEEQYGGNIEDIVFQKNTKNNEITSTNITVVHRCTGAR
jgi:hypothetical protein